MGDAGFEAMRAGLVKRGLIDSRFRLTPAGHAHVDALLVELGGAETPAERRAPAVRWRTDRGTRHG